MVEWTGEPVVETPRLLLRTWRRDDLPRYAELNADPEVMRYLGGAALSRADSDSIAECAQERFAEQGIGLLAVQRRSDGAFLGMCGLHHQQSYPDDVEVAWRFARRFWGRGYATEAADGWLDHGFAELGLPRVISITEWENERSIAVMRRLGMRFDHEADVTDDGDVFRAAIFSITVDAWRARRTTDR